jgi:hypothetical protein
VLQDLDGGDTLAEVYREHFPNQVFGLFRYALPVCTERERISELLV